jgi:O-antigen/teichoic acid export membrane protein
MLLNSLSQVPANLLDAAGRPDVRTKLLLSYLFVYLALAWVLIEHFGIVGAAVAWSLRGGIECVLFMVAASRCFNLRLQHALDTGILWLLLVGITLTIGAGAVAVAVPSLWARGFLGLVGLATLAFCAWNVAPIKIELPALIIERVVPAIKRRG